MCDQRSVMTVPTSWLVFRPVRHVPDVKYADWIMGVERFGRHTTLLRSLLTEETQESQESPHSLSLSSAKARVEEMQKLLEQWFFDKDVREYVLKSLASILFGRHPLNQTKIIFFYVGSGDCAKSFFLSLVQKAFGDSFMENVRLPRFERGIRPLRRR